MNDGTPVLIMMEIVPGSRKFYQMVMSEEQYDKILDVVEEQMHQHTDDENCFATVNMDVNASFPKVSAYYSDKDIKAFNENNGWGPHGEGGDLTSV